MTNRLTITQRGEQERRRMLDFEDPGDEYEQNYTFVTTSEVRFRTVDLNDELAGLQEEEWSRVNSLLAETPLGIAQQMRSEFEAANNRFRMFSRSRANPKEIMASLDNYLRDCLWRDGNNPVEKTNTPMVTQ